MRLDCPGIAGWGVPREQWCQNLRFAADVRISRQHHAPARGNEPEAHPAPLRARAFDISRYLLPLSTNTSLGEIVNARTLESQVAHLLSQPHKEVRDLGANC